MGARLSDIAHHFPALLLTGARQTGKTSLLRRLFPDATFVSLDLPSAAAQADESPEQFLARHREPVVLDEVQYAPGLFRFLKLRIDRRRHKMGRYLMTGSQKFTLMEALSESLAGRCAVVELDTLSGGELRRALGETPDAARILWRGGFPELYRDPDLNARDFQSSYVATYLERDVRSLIRVGSLRDFERFVRACALRSGQLLNLTDLGRDVGIAGTTARDWLSVLEASNQVVLLEPYFSNLGKRMIKTPKLFLRDTGLLCFLLGLDSPEAMQNSPFVGAVWETWVLNQILCARSAVGSGAQIFFWRDAYGTEVDFVLAQGGHLRLIEAKWAETVPAARGLQGLLKVKSLLGESSAKEHWIACRTPHSHTLPGHPDVKLIDGLCFEGWLAG